MCFSNIFKRIINHVFKESDEELLERYNFDVIGCHPPNIGDKFPTFEEWKKGEKRE